MAVLMQAGEKKLQPLADSRKDVIKTLKFPLESESLPFPQSSANELYNVIEGVNKGSLIGFLCAIHLTGFRVFFQVNLGQTLFIKRKSIHTKLLQQLLKNIMVLKI